jgi:hydroxymethylpyrimidine pyrophosphatase-like HAD family hydrolase
MYCRTIACDFDGTGATDERLAPEVAAALGAARAQGISTLLVTGRVFEDLKNHCPDLSVFDVVVAENGAVIFLSTGERSIQLGMPPPNSFLAELRSRGVPFHTGAVIVGTWDRHASEVLDTIRRSGIDGQMVFNRAALMVLPSGVNKATGVERALEELGLSRKNLIAFGDAENDLPLLLAAEIGVAARDSIPSVLAQADDRLSQPGGAGVAQYIHRLLDRGGFAPTPPRRRIVLGCAPNGRPASVPAAGINILISGDPRSGKSWLAGLLIERLAHESYRLCIIDPEGDYATFGRGSGILTFGHDLPLPPAGLVPHLFRETPLSIVLNLSSLGAKEQASYVETVLVSLEAGRAATGIPHWVVVDEAQYFFSSGSPNLRRLEDPRGNFILSTYRPSLIAQEAYDSFGAFLVTKTTVEEERYFVSQLYQARAGGEFKAHEALLETDGTPAGLLLLEGGAPTWQVFFPGERATCHAHHGRKYADARLPEEKAFRFLLTGGEPVVARSVTEFHHAVRSAPLASLRRHLHAGDFSAWSAEVLGNDNLARGLRKLERSLPPGGEPNREEILAHLEDHYLIDTAE